MNRQDGHSLFVYNDDACTHEKHHDSLLMTKCCVPVTPHPLITRFHLMTLLNTARHYPLTLVSAPAGFGKTSLLRSWLQSQPAEHCVVAWLSLDEHDNSPLRFWRYVLLALDQASSDSCTPVQALFHSSQDPPPESVITAILNAFNQTTRIYFLILDDYHVINEPLIHRSLSYLIEHLPRQLRVILLTRTDPPLNCARLRVCRQMLEVRTEHLRCNLQDAARFWRDVIGVEIASALLEAAVNRTEGWFAGLQLLGISWQKCTNQAEMLAQLCGTQHYIRDYLLEQVLQQQSPVLQRFLLCTALLDRFCASLCDAVMEIDTSQTLLEHLERANIFIIPLDEQRHWYRYHHLFAEMLRSRLTQTYGNELCDLHQRASRWYNEQRYVHEVVSHALQANAWEQAADLVEHAARSYSWRDFQTRQLLPWLKQLPSQVVQMRPYLAVTYAQANIASTSLQESELWLQKIEANLDKLGSLQTQEEQNRLLGHLFALRAQTSSYLGEGATALAWCQKALAHLYYTIVYQVASPKRHAANLMCYLVSHHYHCPHQHMARMNHNQWTNWNREWVDQPRWLDSFAEAGQFV